MPGPSTVNQQSDRPAGRGIVALTGGIGAGKSTVAAMLADRGAYVVDADQLDLRAREREQERNGVIVPRVAIDENGRRHAATSASTSRAVGSDGWAPGRDAAITPAAQARSRDSS